MRLPLWPWPAASPSSPSRMAAGARTEVWRAVAPASGEKWRVTPQNGGVFPFSFLLFSDEPSWNGYAGKNASANGWAVFLL